MNKELNSLNRIVILEKHVKADLSRCNVCNINFTAFQPCIICQLIVEKEQDLGRKLTKKEFNNIVQGISGGER